MDFHAILSGMIDIFIFLVMISIIFFSIVTHEVAHGYIAYRLGDPTAKSQGRLTFNPIPHIDKTGSILFLVTLILTILKVFPIPIGYAKPVMVDFRHFRDPRKDMAKVAAAGPAANILVAVVIFGIFLVLSKLIPQTHNAVRELLVFAIFINTWLAALNLIPIPPLDGSNILAGFLPWKFTLYFHKFHKFGIGLLLLLVVIIGKERLLIFVEKFFSLFGMLIE